MKVVSTTSKNGIWTRVNRNNPEEKSIIDYIMTDYDITDQIEDIEVDEEGCMRPKGKNETDHNTIQIRLNMKVNNKKKKKPQQTGK